MPAEFVPVELDLCDQQIGRNKCFLKNDGGGGLCNEIMKHGFDKLMS